MEPTEALSSLSLTAPEDFDEDRDQEMLYNAALRRMLNEKFDTDLDVHVRGGPHALPLQGGEEAIARLDREELTKELYNMVCGIPDCDSIYTLIDEEPATIGLGFPDENLSRDERLDQLIKNDTEVFTEALRQVLPANEFNATWLIMKWPLIKSRRWDAPGGLMEEAFFRLYRDPQFNDLISCLFMPTSRCPAEKKVALLRRFLPSNSRKDEQNDDDELAETMENNAIEIAFELLDYF